jgi:hypothetical protein
MIRLKCIFLQQKQFQVDAEPTDTVLQLKEKVKEAQGHTVESQKLIYSGATYSIQRIEP